MRTATHQRGNGKLHLYPARVLQAKKVITKKIARLMPTLKPVKSINKQVVKYVTNKPYQTIGIVALVSSLVLGAIYTKFK